MGPNYCRCKPEEEPERSKRPLSPFRQNGGKKFSTPWLKRRKGRSWRYLNRAGPSSGRGRRCKNEQSTISLRPIEQEVVSPKGVWPFRFRWAQEIDKVMVCVTGIHRNREPLILSGVGENVTVIFNRSKRGIRNFEVSLNGIVYNSSERFPRIGFEEKFGFTICAGP